VCGEVHFGFGKKRSGALQEKAKMREKELIRGVGVLRGGKKRVFNSGKAALLEDLANALQKAAQAQKD
jgi:hypothetical protein